MRKVVLESYAPSVPGYFIYYPSRAQRSAPLRLFIGVAKELLLADQREAGTHKDKKLVTRGLL